MENKIEFLIFREKYENFGSRRLLPVVLLVTCGMVL
jgi:hypothetical protein